MGQKEEFIALVSACRPKKIRYPPLSLKLESVFDSAVIVVAKTLEKSSVDENCLAKSLLRISKDDAVFAYALSIVYFNCEKVRKFIKERCNDKMKNVYIENLLFLLFNTFFSG